ncbi:rhodanese-like domain-containing protein [Ramlibacter sp. AN1133]|uniref:rhodanese-like domain-containing protein n=1 Tax=Ramlibacter sp. AN1133 TaxID=3133429 RepID=UPI0030BE02B5
MQANLNSATGSLRLGISKWVAGALLAVAANALAGDVPSTLAGVAVVTAEHAKSLMDGGAAMIDTRVGNEYADSHIKGAKNVTYKEKSPKDVAFNPKDDRFDLAQLPADKSRPVIFYCNGPECWKSYKASKVAAEAGYKKVQWLRGGFPEWKARGFPIE